MSERLKSPPKFTVPAYRVYPPGSVEDYSLQAMVIAIKTGLFGKGIPIYIGPFTEGASLTPEQKVITIKNGQTMFISPEHTADKWINGRWVSVAQAELRDMTPEEKDLDS